MKFNYPSLASAKLISVDTETFDPGIDRGTGSAVKSDGYIVGISLSTDDGFNAYLPVGHAEGNLPRDRVMKWLNKELGRETQTKVGMRFMYDLDFLQGSGVKVKGPLDDVRLMDKTLLEHHQSYALDAIAERHLKGKKKTGDELWASLAEKFGGAPTRKAQISKLYTAPVELVAPYAIMDTDLPMLLHPILKKKLETAELWDVARREGRLIPLLLRMREAGIRINVAGTEKFQQDMDRLLISIRKRIRQMTGGQDFNLNATASLVPLYDYLGIKVPLTDKGNPSITEEWLENQGDALSPLVRRGRLVGKFSGTFAENMIMGHLVNGRIYSELDSLGAHTGRFSCRNPNLQQAPARVDKELAQIFRGLFLPEKGCDWGAYDYSQIEYRLAVHYGQGESADKAREAYRTDPKTDYHQMVMDWTGLTRGEAKPVNFGKIYRAGLPKLAATAGLSLDRMKEIVLEYDRLMPFIKEMGAEVQEAAENEGEIRCLLGAKRHFPKWESRHWDTARTDGMMTREQAEEKYGRNIRRAGCYKALSMLIQGSAAEVIKEAMVRAWEAGVYDVLTPHLTVHDELDQSIPRTKLGREAATELKEIMQNVGKELLTVPLLVDAEIGPDWGHVA